MTMKKRYSFGLCIVVSFFIFSMITFKDSLAPYVSFAEAKTANGTVQVQGTPTSDSISITSDKKLSFRLRDQTGEEELVVYTGAKPEGLEYATGIVAIGKYQNNQFQAEKLLVKCPSKYQRSVNQ
ncbi:Cytochrome c-type biogenesis protein CcmE [Sporomusa silvacetica DSM 10669]|uniref:Cytochrome c-type biogenesis protein CcmE n=1 Tax=Sporomusa silvacetica DSM 10669 TaxID=1123289 RepID=A0ABZ3IPZ1_9FIRM|nr:cytochrome c-type biogenesis protein CcmE [Sporomusa silvacetica DSM 10669]